MSQTVDREIPGRLEEVSSQETERLRLIEAKESSIGLLRHFVSFGLGAQPGDQEGKQLLVVLDEQPGKRRVAALPFGGSRKRALEH
jgi:hypothetical protein